MTTTAYIVGFDPDYPDAETLYVKGGENGWCLGHGTDGAFEFVMDDDNGWLVIVDGMFNGENGTSIEFRYVPVIRVDEQVDELNEL